MQERYVALDLETTGLSAKTDRIIEIGAVKVENGQIIDTFSSYINPHMKISERITNLTGIRQEDVDEAPALDEVLPEFLRFLGEYDLVGHRILFDYSFLKRACTNSKISFEKKGADTLKIARKMYPNLESKRLSDMCTYFNIPITAHRAFSDAEAAHKLYEALWTAFCKKTYEQGSLITENDFDVLPLHYRVKREAPASERQKARLRELIVKHRVSCDVEIDSMTKNEVSRLTDHILAEYGR